jgi:hypothetical protein
MTEEPRYDERMRFLARLLLNGIAILIAAVAE